MSLSTQKRQVDTENRRFNPAWTDKYLFILPPNPNAKPMCLICNECVAVPKDYNVRRHHMEKHPTFRSNFPEGSKERAAKMQSLLASYNRSCAKNADMQGPRESYSRFPSCVMDLGKKEKAIYRL